MISLRPDLKILIVDDYPTMRRIIRTLLKQNGFSHVFEAEDGGQALSLLEADPGFGLIVSDWDMPLLNGLELLRAVRAADSLKHIPFLIIASETERKQLTEAIKAGATNYILKPFTGQGLKEKLEKLDQVTARLKAKS